MPTYDIDERPNLHQRFPDLSPSLLNVLAWLGDEYGPRGVVTAAGGLWPDAARRALPEGMTPERLRGMAMVFDQAGYPASGDLLRRWADELAAQIEGGGADRPAIIDAAHLDHQRQWSIDTFGPGARTKGVIDHIRKELAEIEADPADVSEWIDVVILAFDGALRAGHEPQEVINAMKAKQAKNEARQWPDWRTRSQDEAIEHVRKPVDARPPAPTEVRPALRAGTVDLGPSRIRYDYAPLNDSDDPFPESCESCDGQGRVPATPGRPEGGFDPCEVCAPAPECVDVTATEYVTEQDRRNAAQDRSVDLFMERIESSDGEGERRGRRKRTLREYLAGDFDAPERDRLRAEHDALLAELAGALAERDALAAKLAAYPEVPEGSEVLVVEREVVDLWHGGWGVIKAAAIAGWGDALSGIVAAARAAVARRPKPEPRTEPRTERVPWGTDLLGRCLPDGREVCAVYQEADDRIPYVNLHSTDDLPSATNYQVPVASDGTVEVLDEDGES